MDNDDDICDERFESVKEEVFHESSIDSDADRDERGDERFGSNRDAFIRSNPDNLRRNEDDEEMVMVLVKEILIFLIFLG